jgi:teichuronic acid exporter
VSLKKQAVSGMLWTLLQQFGVQGISFVISLMLARLILPAEFGLIGMISVLVGLGNIFINSGMNQSLLRSSNSTEKDFSTIFYFNVLLSILAYVSVYFFAPVVSEFYAQERLTNIIRIYCILFVLNGLSSIHLVKMSLRFEFRRQAVVAIPSVIIGGALGIFLAYRGFGVWSIIWSAILQSFLMTMQLWYLENWVPLKVFDKTSLFHHWKFGSKLLYSGIIDSIFMNLFSIIIGKWYLASEVGFYQRAESLKQFPVSNISQIVNKVTYPLLASVQNNDSLLKNAYRQIIGMLMFITAPILIFSAVLSEPLFTFIFTDRWLSAAEYYKILIIGGMLYPIHAFNLNVLNIKGRSDLFLKLEIIKMIILIVIIFISFQWGIYGLLFGTIASSIIAFFINTFFTHKLIAYGAWLQIKDIFPSVFLAAVIGVCTYFLDIFFVEGGLNNFRRILFGFSISFGMYVVFSLVFHIKAAKELILIIKNR